MATSPPPAAVRSSSRPRLGEILVRMGLIEPDELAEVLHRQQADGRRLGELLVAEGRLTHAQLEQALAARLGVRSVDLSAGVDPEVAHLLDERTCRRYAALPVRREADGRILIAMADPHDVLAVDDLRMMMRAELVPALAPRDSILAAIASASARQKAPPPQQTAVDRIPQVAPGTADVLAPSPDDGPAVRRVNQLIAHAIKERASDIHFEPVGERLQVRFRVDGVLRAVAQMSKEEAGPVIGRLKIMADLDIAERRLPQDGRVALAAGGKPIDLRVASLPTVEGEGVVLRLLDRSKAVENLEDLGFQLETLGAYRRVVSRPYGLILVTGPTGSGKSTTLHATLAGLNSGDRKIITIEDPVEYRLPGVSQIQINNKAGLTFASGLRSILRNDPDTVMVGEIRDRETAQIAIESALTGHLVLATIHTNDAASAVTRLIEMEVEPFLVASAVLGILAQRLVRRVCRHCMQRATVSHSMLRALADTTYLPRKLPEPAPVPRAVGCDKCSRTGYRGRIGVYEMLIVDEEISRLTVERAPAEKIRQQARRAGMMTMREDTLRKLLTGKTTLEEMGRAVR